MGMYTPPLPEITEIQQRIPINAIETTNQNNLNKVWQELDFRKDYQYTIILISGLTSVVSQGVWNIYY